MHGSPEENVLYEMSEIYAIYFPITYIGNITSFYNVVTSTQ